MPVLLHTLLGEGGGRVVWQKEGGKGCWLQHALPDGQ